MNHPLEVGIVGDFNPDVRYHLSTNEAIGHAAEALSVSANYTWVATDSLHAEGGEAALERFDALWIAPWSPYRSSAGVHRGIRFARENGRPLVAT
jgi:CTP synthase (UTP-ammonia lyase)